MDPGITGNTVCQDDRPPPIKKHPQLQTQSERLNQAGRSRLVPEANLVSPSRKTAAGSLLFLKQSPQTQEG